MTELMFGRYFVLEGKVENLFSWIEHNTESEWSVEAKGICPISEQIILVSVFALEQDLIRFETEYLHSQNNQSPIYANRRDSRFSWPASKERRSSVDRRQLHLVDDARNKQRRSTDIAEPDFDQSVREMGSSDGVRHCS